MCDNEAFEFAEVLPADDEVPEPPATARAVTIDMCLATPRGGPETKAGHVIFLPQKQLLSVDKLRLTDTEKLMHRTPVRCVSAAEATPLAAESLDSGGLNEPVLIADAATLRQTVSAKASTRSMAAVDAEAAGRSFPQGGAGGLAAQLASVFGKSPQRISFVDRARAYRQHQHHHQHPHQHHHMHGCVLPDEAHVFDQLLEPVPYGEGGSGGALLSMEQLHNLMAERRQLTAIVDCREEGETSRLDLSHLVAFSARDLLEAESQQLERINKGHRYLVLVSNLATCPKEDLLALREGLMGHLQLCCNSCALSIHVLDCDVNLAAYLGAGSPAPTVFEDSIYLIPEHSFVLSSESLSLYESVLTDSKSVEKFCHFQSSRRLACLRVASLVDDVEAALWLMRRTEERDECALLCFGCLAVGKALVVAYTMWKHRHLLRDAVKRVRDAWAVVELDSTRERELLEIENRLFCPSQT